MLNHNNNSDRGFTLIELLVAIIILGILAALSTPSLLGLFARLRVNSSIQELEGAIKESQRQATRLGRLCRVNVRPRTNVVSGSPTQCLLGNRHIDDNIIVRTNLSGNPPNISFSYLGNTTKMGTIVLSSDYTDSQKCFVIALGTGISRMGNYIGERTGSVSASNCTTFD